MFRYNVRGENIEVTEAIRDYVEKKVGKLERYFNDVPEATAHVNWNAKSANSKQKSIANLVRQRWFRQQMVICSQLKQTMKKPMVLI